MIVIKSDSFFFLLFMMNLNSVCTMLFLFLHGLYLGLKAPFEFFMVVVPKLFIYGGQPSV
jgi:hypothetical protein